MKVQSGAQSVVARYIWFSSAITGEKLCLAVDIRRKQTMRRLRPQKINARIKQLQNSTGRKVRIMFQDEAGFGRINKPRNCWCEKGMRPTVPCHHTREYMYAFGGVDPIEGDSCFLVLPYTPEMNPIEQIWKELRQIGFRNEIFATLDKVVDCLCDSINSLSKNTIMSITGRDWILRCFN